MQESEEKSADIEEAGLLKSATVSV